MILVRFALGMAVAALLAIGAFIGLIPPVATWLAVACCSIAVLDLLTS